jgi:hypothetical protein
MRRFAQPHVVGQDASDPIGGEALEPGKTDTLIIAQLALEAGGSGDLRQHLIVAQFAQEGFDLTCFVGAARHKVVDIDQQVGFGQRYLKLFVEPAPAVEHRFQHAEQAFHPAGGKHQDAAILKHKLGTAIDHPHRRHAAAVDQAG